MDWVDRALIGTAAVMATLTVLAAASAAADLSIGGPPGLNTLLLLAVAVTCGVPILVVMTIDQISG